MEAAIPGSTVKVFERARHCAHIEHAAAFNALALGFLQKHASSR
jgi:pimeloyl-ACP methyl ester carboxylesterase